MEMEEWEESARAKMPTLAHCLRAWWQESIGVDCPTLGDLQRVLVNRPWLSALALTGALVKGVVDAREPARGQNRMRAYRDPATTCVLAIMVRHADIAAELNEGLELLRDAHYWQVVRALLTLIIDELQTPLLTK